MQARCRQSLTTWTHCRRSCSPRGNGVRVVIDNVDNGVGVVVDYADIKMTTQTLLENVEGFSQILKEQLGKERYTWMCLHTQQQ